MITPIQTNGMIAHTQDVHIIRHNEDTKVAADYQNSLSTIENKDDRQAKTVVSADDSTEADTRHDAREEGKNKYIDLRNKNKKKPVPDEGTVVKKDNGGFDLRI